MIRIEQIRRLVFSRHKTIDDFSKSVDWSRNKAGRILRGQQQPDNEDIITMAEHFGISEEKEYDIPSL